MSDYTVIIPTLNAASFVRPLIESLQKQTYPPQEIFIIDSSSTDETLALAAHYDGVRTVCIPKSEFDHGRTRNLGVSISGAPFFVMMSQDALPADEQCMEHLLDALHAPGIAAVTARQTARPEAPAYEQEVRRFRYPEESCCWGKKDLSKIGIRGYLISDVCAAYNREAFDSVGGYKEPLPCNEDMLIAADFLDHGFNLVYCAEAVVFHSHHYSLKQEFGRNALIGRFLRIFADRFRGCSDTGEGLRMLGTVTRKLVKNKEFGSILPFWMNCAARYLGNRCGRIIEKKHA